MVHILFCAVVLNKHYCITLKVTFDTLDIKCHHFIYSANYKFTIICILQVFLT